MKRVPDGRRSASESARCGGRLCTSFAVRCRTSDMESNQSAYNQTTASNGLIYMACPFRDPESSRPQVFASFLVIYVTAVVGNMLLCLVIYREESLHKPMFILLANLAAGDLIGSTTTLPRIMNDLMFSNYISIPACFTQMFFLHFYIGFECFVLTSMAVDRYLAICHPLRYHSLMSNARAARLSLFMVLVIALLVFGLIGLTVRLTFCKPRVVFMPHCDHMSFVKMACDDTSANNVYGIFITVLIMGFGLALIVMSYACILYECCKSSVRNSQQKAIYTCVTHLFVLVIFYSSTMLQIVQHRLAQYNVVSDEVRAYLIVLFYIVPPPANPIIYGLRTAEIRHGIVKLFRRKVEPAMS
ncbi:olfactory receptor 52K1-like [Lampetra fluviatilis]